MNIEIMCESNSHSASSKINIKADDYSKSRTFNMDNTTDERLNRVDSTHYPGTTDDLDNLAEKMGFKQQNNNASSCKSTLNKLQSSEENLINKKGLSKSFQVTTDKHLEIFPNKGQHKKTSFMSNIIRHLSVSTPKKFKKNKKSKINTDESSNENQIDHLKNSVTMSHNDDRIVNGVTNEKQTQFTPKSKSIRKILQKLTRKKGKGKFSSEPPSSVESRPSLSSVANHGLNYESATSCNDIFVNKVCKNELQKLNCSADCILDYSKQLDSKKHQESISSTSEDLIEHEAKLNAAINTIPHDQLSDEFPEIEKTVAKCDKDNISPLSIKTNEYKFESQRSCHSTMSGSCHAENSNNVRLTLALYGYTNYGLSSSRLASKSCMEFRTATTNKKMKMSMENVSVNKLSNSVDYHKKNTCDEEFHTEEGVPMKQEITKTKEIVEQEIVIRPEDFVDNSEAAVVLRKSQRPNDIKIRKSREPSQNLAARSSMIMLVVSHNSPRSKIVTNQLSTPSKEMDLNCSLNGPNQHFNGTIPAMRLNFDNLSIKDSGKSDNNDTNKTSVCEKKSISDDITVSDIGKPIENGFKDNEPEIIDGAYFLNLVYKHENDIQRKIDVVQGYLELENVNFEDEVSGQLLVTIGKAKLLLSEKLLQFKGLCEENIRESNEENISETNEENKLRTLLSDLNGFWDMVFGQIEDINKNFVLVEKIKLNNWKMIPYENESKITSNKPPTRSKRSTASTCTPKCTPKKKVSSDVAQQINAEKRKNMMKFKLSQKSSISQQSDPSFSNDITFY